MDSHNPAYSGNVRQQLHKLYNSNERPGGPIVIWEGGSTNYTDWQQSAKFCLAPYGFGWGIRLSIVMAAGCVPVIIQVGSVGAGLWWAVAGWGEQQVLVVLLVVVVLVAAGWRNTQAPQPDIPCSALPGHGGRTVAGVGVGVGVSSRCWW
jgi:hypothetical protein